MTPERITYRNNIERMTVVTSSPARHHSFELLLPDVVVKRESPGFTEELIEKPLGKKPSEWPMEMAQQKAFQDLAVQYVLHSTRQTIESGLVGEIPQEGNGRHLRIYSDTITVSHDAKDGEPVDRVLHKPQDIASWFKDKENGVMALSGKQIEICTAITAIDTKNPATHPATILVRIGAKMKPYELEDVKQIIEKHGAQAVLTTAGGISIWNGGTALYEGDVPLTISIQTDPLQDPIQVRKIPNWQKLDNESIKQILYGAIPEAMDSLLWKIDWIADQKQIIDNIPVTVRQSRSIMLNRDPTKNE